MTSAKEMAELIRASKNIVFMTGAGVSTVSGIPDYRSMKGIYTQSGLKQAEYLLSHKALLYDTDNFYKFIKQLYHPEAKTNIIHQKMSELEKDETRQVTVVTQNIDGLHLKAGSKRLVEFHGTILTCHCEKCGAAVCTKEFLESYRHRECGGLVRPDVVLYDEAINPKNIKQAVVALQKADSIAIVGTTFQVYPFASLIDYANPYAKIYTVNKTPLVSLNQTASFIGDAVEVFELI
ncbi:NAD-dependent protein deacylase [Lactovum miscens]|uniref:protein acetyllysine N-acetyltransferase n=1 Tax=Lactovum miscens TaxID=190387 RepID=A0A841C494_9LACT|nr:NAD-dependent protein deacylase [Lactovum miscens]MBB5888746.1 NAD-dependent deacetylase [Lactovum miscens]